MTHSIIFRYWWGDPASESVQSELRESTRKSGQLTRDELEEKDDILGNLDYSSMTHPAHSSSLGTRSGSICSIRAQNIRESPRMQSRSSVISRASIDRGG